MYKSILIPLDNSKYSNSSVEAGIMMAKGFGSTLTCSHVYASRLHDDRFRQMENGLPPQYQNEQELQRQRNIHDSLITKGLQVISGSYIEAFEKRCAEARIPYKKKTMEGKNYLEIVKDVQSGGYDLVIMGALGLGEVEKSVIGSVCERVMRRITTDMMVVRDDRMEGRYMVCIDGSPNSFAGLLSAIAISRITGAEIEAIAAFDPHYHYVAFKSIAGVLSEEAGKIFKFREQEKLHEEIIDKGLAKIYQDHLDRAAEMAKGEGVTIRTTLLTGKPYDQILKYVEKESPSLLVMGRVGVHAAPGLDIGSNTENCVRSAQCNVLIVSREAQPPVKQEQPRAAIPWTPEAEELLNRIPPMARGMVRKMVEEFAVKRGYTEVTADYIRKAREIMHG
jgi:nucleotide-binding universal stress UspA family protein